LDGGNLNLGVSAVGIILFIFGILVAIQGITMMNNATDFGVIFDETEYYNGYWIRIGGAVLAFIGFIILIIGLFLEPSEKRQQPVPPYQQPYFQQPPPQPQYPPVAYYPPPHTNQPPPPQAQPVQVSKVQPKICPACGVKNNTVAKFCNECGRAL
jgi:hypothetical protein